MKRFTIVVLLLSALACSRPATPPTTQTPSPPSASSTDQRANATSEPGDRALENSTTASPAADSNAKTSAAASEWPNWLGPNRNGISAESGWRSDWTTTPPSVAWRGQIGIGFSAVSVSGGRLYTMGYRDGQDVVHCLDAATGEKRWEHAYRCSRVDNLHEGGPGATPTVVGGRVYTLSREGHLHCLDAETGKVLWLRQFKSEIGAVQPDWGFTSSPYLSGENVLVDVGFVTAVDRTSGEIRWKSPQHRAGYGTPTEFELAGRRLIAVSSNDGLSIYDAGNGEEAAFHPYESRFLTTSTTPIVNGDTIFVSVGYGGGGSLLRLAEGGLQVVYASKEMANHFNNCVLYEGHLYGFDGDSHASSQVRLVCMEHATGKVRWHERGFGCGSLMIADGKLIALTDSGTLVAAAATPTKFQELGRVQVLDGKCWTMPVLAGGRIFCRTAAGELACVDVRG